MDKEELRTQTEATKKKISAAVSGKKNSQYKDGRRSYRNVAKAKPGQHVHHKNNDSKDNRPSNLEKFPEKGPGRAKHEKKHNRAANFHSKTKGRKKVKRGYVAKRSNAKSLKNQ